MARGYHTEVCGNLTGEFTRATDNVPVRIIEGCYAGHRDNVLMEIIATGKRGIAHSQSLMLADAS
jgi:hypothetical protein